MILYFTDKWLSLNDAYVVNQHLFTIQVTSKLISYFGNRYARQKQNKYTYNTQYIYTKTSPKINLQDLYPEACFF